MPMITPFIPGRAWMTATLESESILPGLGAFLEELVNFIIVAFIVFIIKKNAE